MRLLQSTGVMLALTIMLAGGAPSKLDAQTNGSSPDYVIDQFGEGPTVPDGPLSDALSAAVQTAFVDSVTNSTWGREQQNALRAVADSGDPRLAWIISDLMRFVSNRQFSLELAGAASELLERDLQVENPWGAVTDHLIAWDIPAPPEYLPVKRAIFTSIVPGWDRIFVEGDIDW
ncbi:MAG: hypothetical protein HRU32_14960, partial [Rhodobacteraceae bacterium]|nr:hypothetical protein [Paracoccaceae bacterium]